jgi:hypothetical protein
MAGECIITRPLPYFGCCKIDYGTTMMNFGAIVSLTGFALTDVLLLRTFSIVGSLCGVIYNVTRVPKQLNAVLWGFIFIGVNGARTVQLLFERREIQFTVEEANVYYQIFQPHGVEPAAFKRVLERAKWKTVESGKDIVSSGKPLNHVHILVDGAAIACEGKNGKCEGKRLYSYTSQANGCIIGATAIVDPSIIGSCYPNRIVAEGKVRLLSFNTKELREFFSSADNGAPVEAALLHMIYADLIGNLRRHRKGKAKVTIVDAMSDDLSDLKEMLVSACADGTITPSDRRRIREHMEQRNISSSQLKTLLESEEIGWTEVDWKDGARFVKSDTNQRLPEDSRA